jgi:hypothetical protein
VKYPQKQKSSTPAEVNAGLPTVDLEQVRGRGDD